MMLSMYMYMDYYLPMTERTINFMEPAYQNHSIRTDRIVFYLTHHGADGDGPAGVVVHGDEVDEEGGAADADGDEEGRERHLADPDLAAHARVERAAEVAVDGRRGRVDEDGGGEEGAALRVEVADDGEEDDADRDDGDLVAGADQRREEQRARRGAEHVAVYLEKKQYIIL